MIWTSSYDALIPWHFYNTCSISGDGGISAGYEGRVYLKLAPRKEFWKKWHDNKGIVPDDENNRFYIQEYWNQILSKLNPEDVYKELDWTVLLCHEANNKFCHRHIVSAWFELFLGVAVNEIKADHMSTIKVEKPEYIKIYLDEIIKANVNMKGYKTLRGLYLFEKAEQLEAKADELERKTGECGKKYRQYACFYRKDADIADKQ